MIIVSGKHPVRGAWVTHTSRPVFSTDAAFSWSGGSAGDEDLVLYSGRLRVEAGPAPVQVRIDGRDFGTAPVATDLATGEHVVRLTKAGFVEAIKRVGVRTGRKTELKVDLVEVAKDGVVLIACVRAGADDRDALGFHV